MKNNFTFDFFAKNIVYVFYQNIYNKTISKDYYKVTDGNEKFNNDVTIVRNIPPYFDARLKASYNYYKIYHRSGFLANLEGYSDFESYINNQLKPKSRSRIRSSLRRLETCFPIQYKMYFGEISKSDYDSLFQRLRIMIGRRFFQRGDTHQSLEHWEYLKKNIFDMINEKKASFFVIYDSSKPINICINYHHQNIFRNYIKSYDIDYSKFKLGYIDIWKQLEWCFKNNYSIFDLSYGELAYKRTWCNTSYRFEQHIIYAKQYHYLKLKAIIITIFLRFKWFLEGKKIMNLQSLIKFKINKTKAVKINKDPIFLIEDISTIDLNTLRLKKIDTKNNKYAFLRKPVYDFQYINFEKSNTINVFKLEGYQNTYIISGQTKKQRLTYNF